MKNILIAASMLAFAVSGADAQRIEPINKVVDCGQVTYQTPVTAEFEIKNKDNHSIRISNVRTSCGCTSVDYPKGEIVGDAAFMVRVTYDAQTMGRFEKFIDIYTDNGQSPLMLTMRGTVVREVVDFGGSYDFMLGDIKADRNDLEFDDVSRGERPQQKIHIFNNTSNTVEPVVMHLPAYLEAVVSPSKLKPAHGGVVTVTLDSRKLKDMGLTQTSVYLGSFSGDRVHRSKEISVSAVLLPQFDNLTQAQLAVAPKLYISTDELNLGAFNGKKKLKGDIIIRNDGHSELKINNLQMFTNGIQLSLGKTRLAPGESTKLKITAEQRQLKTVRRRPRVLMITNDPSQPKVVIRINVQTDAATKK